jgi:hypothetical protein
MSAAVVFEFDVTATIGTGCRNENRKQNTVEEMDGLRLSFEALRVRSGGVGNVTAENRGRTRR